MKILFAIPPWHSLDYPCLAAGILHTLTNQSRSEWQLQQRYINLEWAEWLHTTSSGTFNVEDYNLLGENFVFDLTGEWIFSSALHKANNQSPTKYRPFFGGDNLQFEKICFAYQQAPSFIQYIADDIVNQDINVLALSSTFTQNIACLALALAVKTRRPDILTVMGGGNCDGSQGIALHRNYHYLDYVVRGEGELAFPLLLDYLAAKPDIRRESIPGLCWWQNDEQRVNEAAPAQSMEQVPIPNYLDYFSQIAASPLRPFLEPVLVMETARGCWWGEKHHCTFCGLNGSSMKFRSKPPLQAINELAYLTSEYQTLDIVVADNILDMQYFKTFLPTLAKQNWDLRIHYEIKANLKPEQIELMRQAGIAHVQPGIENLSSHVLNLMKKGISGARNVQTLRDCEEANLTVSWNYLLGFPGEKETDYTPIIKQIPNLVHLQPPTGAARLTLERFSPYFDQPWLGFAQRWPHPAYALIYQLPASELDQLAFFYQSPPVGISEQLQHELQHAISDWRSRYLAGAALTHNEFDDYIEVHDLRQPDKPRHYCLRDSMLIAIWRQTCVVCKCTALCRELSPLHPKGEIAVQRTIDQLLELGLLFRDGQHCIRLSTPSIPYRLEQP